MLTVEIFIFFSLEAYPTFLFLLLTSGLQYPVSSGFRVFTFYVVTLRRGRTREQLLLQNYKA